MIMAALCIMLLTGSCHTAKKKDHRDRPKIETVNKSKNKKAGKLKGEQKRIVEEALEWVGTPYRYGGSEKGRGADCSGTALKVYENATGVKLPRTSRQQAEYCKKISKKDVEPGDLVFFATGKNPKVISHVGIMIDDVNFVHASTKKGVIISDMNTPYYQRTFIMYGKVPR